MSVSGGGIRVDGILPKMYWNGIARRGPRRGVLTPGSKREMLASGGKGGRF